MRTLLSAVLIALMLLASGIIAGDDNKHVARRVSIVEVLQKALDMAKGGQQ